QQIVQLAGGCVGSDGHALHGADGSRIKACFHAHDGRGRLGGPGDNGPRDGSRTAPARPRPGGQGGTALARGPGRWRRPGRGWGAGRGGVRGGGDTKGGGGGGAWGGGGPRRRPGGWGWGPGGGGGAGGGGGGGFFPPPARAPPASAAGCRRRRPRGPPLG